MYVVELCTENEQYYSSGGFGAIQEKIESKLSSDAISYNIVSKIFVPHIVRKEIQLHLI